MSKKLNTGTKPSKYTLAPRATLEGIAEERDKYKAALEKMEDNWQELLIFAQEHDAGKYLYVEASEFI